MTYYKPLTPQLRDQINRALSEKEYDLSECQETVYVNALRKSYDYVRTVINALPDGYPLPFSDDSRNYR